MALVSPNVEFPTPSGNWAQTMEYALFSLLGALLVCSAWSPHGGKQPGFATSYPDYVTWTWGQGGHGSQGHRNCTRRVKLYVESTSGSMVPWEDTFRLSQVDREQKVSKGGRIQEKYKTLLSLPTSSQASQDTEWLWSDSEHKSTCLQRYQHFQRHSICPQTSHSWNIPKSEPLNYFIKECATPGKPVPFRMLLITCWWDF